MATLSSSIYTYLENIEPSVYVGVDAITYTSVSPIGRIAIGGILQELNERYSDQRQKPFKFQGAVGYSRGPLRYAEKRDKLDRVTWSVLMVTGGDAQNLLRWRELELKVTRIDLRVDVELRECRPGLAKMLYRARVNPNDGRYIESSTGATYYPANSREGAYFGRIYDTGDKYGKDRGLIWRYEIEVKRGAADPLACELLTSGEDGDFERYISKTVFGIFWENWGVPGPLPGIKPTLNYTHVTLSSPEQKLEWLRRSVAPTVKFLSSLGYTEEIKEMFCL